MKMLGLFSGGLDSLLALRLLELQGVDVECVHFDTAFVNDDRERVVARHVARASSGEACPLSIIDVTTDYLQDVVEGSGGTALDGRGCTGCRSFMLRAADRLARARGIELLFTGEVLGQSAFGQSRQGLRAIEDAAGVVDRVLRPLSARHLPATAAERSGAIDRSGLGDIQGRARRGQLALAGELGIRDHPTPSGNCCRLADPRFARRLRDLLAHRGETAILTSDLRMLRIGRHFRLSAIAKLVLARNAREAGLLLKAPGGDAWSCHPAAGAGPYGRIHGKASDADLERAAALVAHYAPGRPGERREIAFVRGSECKKVLATTAGDESAEALAI